MTRPRMGPTVGVLNMLQYEVSLGPDSVDGSPVAVLLHGRGSHRGDLQALRDHLPADMVLVTPQAPHPGHPWGYGPGWAWYRYLQDDRIEDPTLEGSLNMLDGFIAQLGHALPVSPGRCFLGGFSQGGTTSLAFALTRPGQVDGVLNFSGFLVDSEILDPAGVKEPPPIFWGHGRRDPNIPFELAVRGRDRLQAAGIRVNEHDYDIGHWIGPDEIADAVEWLEELRRRG